MPLTEVNELIRSLHRDALIDAARDNIRAAIEAELQVGECRDDNGQRLPCIGSQDAMIEVDGEDLLGWYAEKCDEFEGWKDEANWVADLTSAVRVRGVLTLRFVIN